ncbi:MAG: hypothetical protein L6R41_002932 [Letrouitia leprolyta]|nr:MAG: hypothetical protein L6R41_002932 [Letrouitia leprolyta]
MSSLISHLRWPRSQVKEPEPWVCAFIPQNILEKVAEAESTTVEQRLSLRSTIAASKEAGKEREDVADKDKNPHEPDLPKTNDAKLIKSLPPEGKLVSKETSEVYIYSGLNSDYVYLPGQPLRGNNQPAIEDKVANICYDAMGKADQFFREVYGWKSIDDKNYPLVATVHYGWNVANAFFYAKAKQMIFGNGNDLMKNFVGSYDVVGHELCHGIIQYSSGMLYQNQSGALNESCSDVFGALLEQWTHNQSTEEADWLLAQDVLFPEDPKIAMRSMKAPGTAYDDPRMGKDNQPGHMKDYVKTDKDHGGVHINSGIPNHAFYLAAVKKGGYAWETAGKTWFAAMTTATPNETFAMFANRTIKEAERLDKGFAPIVRQAWVDVGVLTEGSGGWFGWLWGTGKEKGGKQ